MVLFGWVFGFGLPAGSFIKRSRLRGHVDADLDAQALASVIAHAPDPDGGHLRSMRKSAIEPHAQ